MLEPWRLVVSASRAFLLLGGLRGLLCLDHVPSFRFREISPVLLCCFGQVDLGCGTGLMGRILRGPKP